MDLAELKFVVNTEQLVDAAKKIDALATSVSKVNKPITTAALESEKLALAQAKVAEATAKAETAQVKLKDAQERGTKSTGGSVSVLERQNMILEYMAQGLSKGQSSYMATAKAAGALDDELQQLLSTLRTQRTLQGSEPFDKSIGLYQKLQNETRISTEVNQLFNRNLGLTEKQMVDLAREKERLIALYGIEGRSLNSLNGEYEKIVQKSAEINRSNNARTESMKAQIKAQSDAAKATAYLADADARLAAALADTNKSLDKQATDALVKYEKALKQTGMSADDAAAKLAVAKKQFEGIADKKQADRLQYLARAISVQMGDVGISLASGMNPLLVMIQQGDQIRGAIQQAGASGKELERAMAGAATQIATSFLQTGQAIGGFFVNAIKSAGKAIFDLPISIATSAFGALTGTVESSAVAFDRLKVAAISFARVGVVAVIATLAALAIEYVKVAAAEKELTKSLAVSGAALGMSTTDAIVYADSMNDVGISTMKAMRIIGEFANTGADASIPLKQIIASANDMEKYVGIATADTMKSFADISEKPVEGLIKLAKSTGNVSIETILLAEAAVKAGDNAEAARIAQEALSNSNDEIVRRMKNNLDPLQTLWMDIKSAIGKAGEAIYDLLKSSTMIAIFRTAWETVAVIVTEVWYVLKQTGTEISGIFSQIKAVMSGDFAGAAKIGEQMKIDAAAAREEQDKLVASIMNRNKAEKETLTITEEQRKTNRKAAKELEERLKNQKAATFKIPEDIGLKDIQNKHKIAMDSINAESNRMISANKVAYSLGLKDVGDYMAEEIQLIVDFNNKRVSENNSYIEKLNTAEASQLAAIQKSIGIAKSHAKTKEDVIALDKQLTDTVNNVKESYNRLRDSVKATNDQLADKSAEAQMKAIENLGQYTKKAMEGSKEFARTLDDTAAKRKLQIELENQLVGLAGAELARVKAQIDAEQSHISKLSELEKAALQAGVAMSKLTLSGLDPNDPKYKAAAEAVKNANAALEEARGKSRQEITQAGIDAEVLYYKQEYNKAVNSVTDALVNSLGKGWKKTGEALRNALIAELKEPITLAIRAAVDVVYSGLNSLIGGQAGSTLGSTIAGKIGGIAIGGTTLAAGASAFGQGLASSFGAGAPVASMGAPTSAAFNAGAAAGPVAGAVGGMVANRVISNGYSTGKNSQTIQDIATIAATMVFGPIGGIAAGVISGVFNRAFGMKAKQITGEGIVGTLTTQGADVKAFEDWFQKGGWFRSNKSGRNLSAVSVSLQEYLDLSLSGLTATTKKYAEILGLQANDIDGVTKSIELNLKGLSAEDRQKKIDEALGGFGNELAKKLGFESFDALEKLGQQVLQQRYDLETQLLTLQGDSVALRERERDKIYETNKALFDQIKALEDKKVADEKAAEANAKAAEAMEKLTSITTKIVDEINRLRGVNTSSADLESQFAILTAQARSGDLSALAQLPEITRGLEQIAASTAVNATDIIFARARLAQSLQDTLAYTGGFTPNTTATSTDALGYTDGFSTTATTPVTIASVSATGAGVSSSVNSASSNQELLAALVTEMQGLRVEVRADVSHNAKTAKILERVNQDGETLSVSSTIDGGVF